MKVLPDGFSLRWLGHSAFFLRTKEGLRVLIDPWLEAPTSPQGIKEEILQEGVDLIFLTHGHSDHVGNTVEIAKKTSCKIVCIYEIMLYLVRQGIPQERLLGINKWGAIEEKDIKAWMVNAIHSSGIDVGKDVYPGGEAAGYVFRLGEDFYMYHTGDTGPSGDIEVIKDIFSPQLVLISMGGYFTMDPEIAAYFIKKLDPEWILPIHWGTFPLLAGTPEELKEKVEEKYKEKILFLKPGDLIS